MSYNELVRAIEHYGSTQEDICKMVLGLNRENINESVIVAPWWEPTVFAEISDNAVFLGQSANVRAWTIQSANQAITYIKTGIGAPLMTDVVLALGLTQCKRLLFVGSVGALDVDISIGDIVIPEFSICGDGASRYLKAGRLANADTFGEKSFPEQGLFARLKQSVEETCSRMAVKYHMGRTFSIDTIFAQFVHIEEIIEMGCNVIEMETAAAFRAAEIAKIPMAALFSVSDNTLTGKSLVSGRSKKEMNYRKEVRRTVFPRIMEKVFTAENAI